MAKGSTRWALPQSVKKAANRQKAEMLLGPLVLRGLAKSQILTGGVGKKACYARLFDLLRNSPRSSIHIHFGGELLVLAALLTSGSLSKNKFFNRLKGSTRWALPL